ncbi:MAG: response regulator [Flavobacteriaceae bacterium]|nr:response regulator [Flavobacteriaceae bacterium]
MIKNYYFFVLMLFSFAVVAQNSTPQEELYSPDPEIEKVGFKQLVDSSDNYYFEGKYHNSLKVNILLLKKALAENDFRYIHMGYRNLGYDYLAISDTVSAEENFRKSMKFAKISKNDTATALSYMDIANLESSVYSNHEKAMEYHLMSIRSFEKINDSVGLAKAHYNTSITAMEAENYTRVLLHLIKAKKLTDYNAHVSMGIGIESLFGEYYLKKQNYEMADIYLTRAIKAAKKENLPVELEVAYEDFSESLFLQQRYQEAYQARQEYEKYAQINLDNSSSEEMEAVSAKFQVAEYRNEVMEAELKNELQAKIVESKSRLNIILIIICFCAILLIGIIMFVLSKRKQLILKLRDKNQEYLKAKRKSEQLSKSKSNFFSTVSHELRTPLYGVIGLSTILLEDESLKSHEKDLKSLKFSADYLLALINDVLQINKIDSNKIEDETHSFNISELIESIASSFEYMRIQNNNRIVIVVSEELPKYLQGNSVRLSQVLMNLVGNACKFTENGTIYIKAESVKLNEDKAMIKFSVKDTGIGIATDRQASIFDEFEQGETLNYNYQGTGLGLPIVKKLLSLSNSDIKVTSQLGKGSTFSFDLEFDVSSEENIKQEITLDTNQLNGKKILVAEDNRINQIVTKKILEKNGIVCTIAENGQIASDMVQKENYDLILMDLNMPVKDGFQASKEIRTFNNSIPIVALTAVEVEEVRNEIFDSGMSDIIVKPYDANKFIQTILLNINEQGRPLGLERDKKVI